MNFKETIQKQKFKYILSHWEKVMCDNPPTFEEWQAESEAEQNNLYDFVRKQVKDSNKG